MPLPLGWRVDENVERKRQLEIELPRSSCQAAALNDGGDSEQFKISTTEVSKTRAQERLHADVMKRSSACSDSPWGSQLATNSKANKKQDVGAREGTKVERPSEGRRKGQRSNVQYPDVNKRLVTKLDKFKC